MSPNIYCSYLGSPGLWTRQSGVGFYEESSNSLQIHYRKAMREFFADEVVSRGHGLSLLRGELEEILQECSHEDWDNYGASPINPLAVEEAWSILESMPLNYELPEVSPEPNGGIAFEWRRGESRILALSVVGKHTISFAAIFESGSIHGTEYFEESLPSAISRQYRRLTA